MNDNEIKALFNRYRDGECTHDEAAWVESWFNKVVKDLPSAATVPDMYIRKNRTWKRLGIGSGRTNYLPVLRYAAAIIAIAGLAYGGYWFTLTDDNFLKEQQQAVIITPGGNRAILTLSNGKTIDLQNTANGALANQGGVTVIKNKNGQIVYTVISNAPVIAGKNNEAISYNTITTPNGGQYQVILPDGSLVYLNAASSLKYPTQFTKNERKVNLTGEAFFEVTKDVKRPFVVTTQGQQVKVLGTQFNISAYPRETIKTTLAEGSVELTSSSSLQKQLLKPDQQATLLLNGFQLRHVNAQDEIAWKDGLFVFKKTAVNEVLHQISRWYNVEVDYSNLPDVIIDAEILRTLTLQEVIEVLEISSEVKFNVNGRRLSVHKK